MSQGQSQKYDALVIGTDLECSIVSAFLSLKGYKIFQLDNRVQYGGIQATFSLKEYISLFKQLFQDKNLPNNLITQHTKAQFTDSQTKLKEVDVQQVLDDNGGNSQIEIKSIDIANDQNWQQQSQEQESKNRNFEVFFSSDQDFFQDILEVDYFYQDDDLDQFLDIREYNINIVPKLVYSEGYAIKSLLEAKAAHYLEFNLLDESFVLQAGQLRRVPSSRSRIFVDNSLTKKDKYGLMKAQKQIQILSQVPQDQVPNGTLQQVLQEASLSEELQNMILYTIAMEDTNQQPQQNNFSYRPENCVSIKEGVQRIKQYVASVEKYAYINDCPFLVARYGYGDIPQAFCRTAAVFGTQQALDTKLEKIKFRQIDSSPDLQSPSETDQAAKKASLINNVEGQLRITGLETALDLDLEFDNVIVSERFGRKINQQIQNQISLNQEDIEIQNEDKVKKRQLFVQSAVLITDKSLVSDKQSVLITLNPQQIDIPEIQKSVNILHPIRIIQQGQSARVAPKDRYIVQIYQYGYENSLEDIQTVTYQLFNLPAKVLQEIYNADVSTNQMQQNKNDQSVTQDSDLSDTQSLNKESEVDTGKQNEESGKLQKPNVLHVSIYKRFKEISDNKRIPVENLQILPGTDLSLHDENLIERAMVISQSIIEKFEIEKETRKKEARNESNDETKVDDKTNDNDKTNDDQIKDNDESQQNKYSKERNDDAESMNSDEDVISQLQSAIQGLDEISKG